jgi:hypothetical protein
MKALEKAKEAGKSERALSWFTVKNVEVELPERPQPKPARVPDWQVLGHIVRRMYMAVALEQQTAVPGSPLRCAAWPVSVQRALLQCVVLGCAVHGVQQQLLEGQRRQSGA